MCTDSRGAERSDARFIDTQMANILGNVNRSECEMDNVVVSSNRRFDSKLDFEAWTWEAQMKNGVTSYFGESMFLNR